MKTVSDEGTLLQLEGLDLAANFDQQPDQAIPESIITEHICPREQFLGEIIVQCAGAKHTSEELYEVFGTFCRERKWPSCSRSVFDRHASDRLGGTSHCYGINGSQRGRSGWQIRHDLVSKPSSHKHGKASPEGMLSQ
jgi:hypothetical protein